MVTANAIGHRFRTLVFLTVWGESDSVSQQAFVALASTSDHHREPVADPSRRAASLRTRRSGLREAHPVSAKLRFVAHYLALLRGINVGGKNLIKMVDLKACFEDHGFRGVVTYIQSGNVLFESGQSSSAKLTQRIEAMLGAAFDYRASVVLRTRTQMGRIVKQAPDGFGSRPDHYRYDVLFLKAPLTAKVALESVPTREGVDEVYAGTGVLYFSRLISKASQSRLSRIVSMPIYQSMTIRNWNTTVKLLQMMDRSAS